MAIGRQRAEVDESNTGVKPVTVSHERTRSHPMDISCHQVA